jgi:hypothetical protein
MLIFNLFAFTMTLIFMWMWGEKDRFVAERIAVGVFASVLWGISGNILAYVDEQLFVGLAVFYYVMTIVCFVLCLASAYQLITLRSHRWDNP